MRDRYYVSENGVGYVVYDSTRILPLPFMWFSRQYAQAQCDRFNSFGYRAVAEYYYTTKVAGTKRIDICTTEGENPYLLWMKKHGDMFK